NLCLALFLFSLFRLRPARSTLFPYTTLFRSLFFSRFQDQAREDQGQACKERYQTEQEPGSNTECEKANGHSQAHQADGQADGKRSEEHTSELHHVKISYAVFCLKKKKKNTQQ